MNNQNYKILTSSFFIILFPLFFIYNVLLANDLIIHIPSYFSLFSLIFLVLVFFSFYDNEILNIKFSIQEIIFFLIVILIFFISLANYLLNNSTNYNYELLVYSMNGAVLNIVCYLIAKNIIIEDDSFQKSYMFLFFICFTLILLNLNDNGYFYLKENSINSELIVTYQGFAMILVIISSILFSTTQKFFISNNFIIIVSLIALFLNSARTEFVIFFISIYLYLFIFDFKRTLFKIILIIPVIMIMIVYLDLLSYLYNNRIWELINDFESSTSLNARFETIIYAFETIKNNFLLGEYASYIYTMGLGYYAHNLISAWVDLGLIGFLMYLSILIILFFKLIIYRRYNNSTEYILFFITFVFYTLSILVSKDYTFMFLGFLIGFSARFEKNIY